MANEKMTWERWQLLTPSQKEWEHFSYHERQDLRISALESGKWKRTISQVIASFAGGIVFWVSVLIFFRDLVPWLKG